MNASGYKIYDQSFNLITNIFTKRAKVATATAEISQLNGVIQVERA
ncbi:hypothetical protein [Desulfitobacterium sp.]|nr:hypothetical protein [Desulfitobacterium sp.]HVJ50606.1 hypothetical protein [Desulfitobacterium sp.]